MHPCPRPCFSGISVMESSIAEQSWWKEMMDTTPPRSPQGGRRPSAGLDVPKKGSLRTQTQSPQHRSPGKARPRAEEDASPSPPPGDATEDDSESPLANTSPPRWSSPKGSPRSILRDPSKSPKRKPRRSSKEGASPFRHRDALEGGGGPPTPPRLQGAQPICPATFSLTPSAGCNGISNRQ